jgi:hypothetical protein
MNLYTRRTVSFRGNTLQKGGSCVWNAGLWSGQYSLADARGTGLAQRSRTHPLTWCPTGAYLNIKGDAERLGTAGVERKSLAIFRDQIEATI